jgi:hypothetical protein
MRCRHCGVENLPTDSRCVRCGSALVAIEGSGKTPIRKSVKAAAISLLSIAIACIIIGLAAHTAVHRAPVLMTDPEEPDVPDDYDLTMLEGELSGNTYVITLTVAGEIQAGEYYGIIPLDFYRVGLWVKEIGRSSSYVYDLLYIEGEEQHYGLSAVRDGSTLTFEFPLSLLWNNAYVVGLSAATECTDAASPGATDWIETPSDDYVISHLLELPFSPFLLFAAAAICILVALAYLPLRL